MKEGNSAYPACLACHQSNATCNWQLSAFLSHIGMAANRRKTCERCYGQKIQCRLAWEDADVAKQNNGEHLERAGSPKFLKLEDDAMDALNGLGDQLGEMVKLFTQFSTLTFKTSESNKALLGDIKEMVEKLQENKAESASH